MKDVPPSICIVEMYGQLGSATNSGSLVANQTPLDVQGLDSGIAAIAAGGSHNLALTSDGTVKAWGNNPVGQLGHADNFGTSDPNSSPQTVAGLIP